MKRLLWLILVMIFMSGCVGESSYQADTGTFTIPWGHREGKNVPAEAASAAPAR